MREIKIIMTIVLISIQTIYSQEVLNDDYYFVSGKELTKIQKSNDTIYLYKCNSTFDCLDKYRNHFKILKSEEIENITLLKMERLDSIPMTTDPYPEDRFGIVRIEKLQNGVISYISDPKYYTNNSINNVILNKEYLEDRFGFSFYTKKFLTTLKMDNITKNDARAILESAKENKKIIEKYKQTNTGDIYFSGIASELINIELIKRNLSPLNGKNRVNDALKK